jgi:hypothetical protein
MRFDKRRRIEIPGASGVLPRLPVPAPLLVLCRFLLLLAGFRAFGL